MWAGCPWDTPLATEPAPTAWLRPRPRRTAPTPADPRPRGPESRDPEAAGHQSVDRREARPGLHGGAGSGPLRPASMTGPTGTARRRHASVSTPHRRRRRSGIHRQQRAGAGERQDPPHHLRHPRPRSRRSPPSAACPAAAARQPGRVEEVHPGQLRHQPLAGRLKRPLGSHSPSPRPNPSHPGGPGRHCQARPRRPTSPAPQPNGRQEAWLRGP